MTPMALEVRGLSVRYGRSVAVDDVSLSVPSGSIVSLIGANGAGKTSTLGALMGLQPSSGSVHLMDEDIGAADTEERVERGMTLVPETRALFGSMSVADNLLLGTYTRRKSRSRDELETVFALFPRLKERLRQAAGTLSGGERQMLAIGRAMLMKPRVLLLDEPSLGLAPLVVREVLATVTRLRGLGMTVLLVEQNARAALAISDYGYVFETGRLRSQGPAADLLHDETIGTAYFGGSGITTPS